MARQLGNSPIWYQSRSIQYSRPAWREAPAIGIGWSNIRMKENCCGLRSISLHRRHHGSNVRYSSRSEYCGDPTMFAFIKRVSIEVFADGTT
ncbi:ligatin [Iris pallida]|uniref:Ligatin n=1 Tax=Iris pallida TaxID=29817 RepID=A0AAX6FR91_IRIPA|nr:ligatin [Iris pallida]